MKRFLYFLSVVVVLGVGLAIVLYYGDQPSPIPRMELSRFQDPESFAKTLAEKLHGELKNSPVLLLGITPESPEELEVAEKFLASLKDPDLRYDVVVVEPGLGPEGFFPDAVSVSLVREIDRLVEGIRNARSRNLRAVVIAPSELTSQLGFENAPKKLEAESQMEVMSLSLVPLPRNRSEEKIFPFGCRTESHDRSGMGSIGCVALQLARGTYKMEKDPARFMGQLDQIGDRDFLALFQPPLMKEIEK